MCVLNRRNNMTLMFIFGLLLISCFNNAAESNNINIYINNLIVNSAIPAEPAESESLFENEPKRWALLVAGSNGYSNYRHQADICHAFQLLKANGIPEENIIVMMYDDIAYSEGNPTPGIIINQPGGKDVYKGVKKDYTGSTVNPINFLNVLKGNSTAMEGIGSGKVIDSGPNDYVFVYFSDHGGVGILAFPDDELTVKDLISALEYTAENKRFREMVLYVEACESGSMFEAVLSDTLNIFVMTAADPNESSYACYYDDLRRTYLGDTFSVTWLQEAEKENLKEKSLNHLFEKVRTNTTMSHVEEYGDLDIGFTKLSQLIGYSEHHDLLEDRVFKNPNEDAVPSPDVPMTILLKKLEAANNEEEQAKISSDINAIKAHRLYIDNVMGNIVRNLSGGKLRRKNDLKKTDYKITRSNMDCYSDVIKSFSRTCFSIAKNPFVTRYLSTFVNACSVNWLTAKKIKEVIDSSCSDKVLQITGAV